jgi:hypothetical protein
VASSTPGRNGSSDVDHDLASTVTSPAGWIASGISLKALVLPITGVTFAEDPAARWTRAGNGGRLLEREVLRGASDLLWEVPSSTYGGSSGLAGNREVKECREHPTHSRTNERKDALRTEAPDISELPRLAPSRSRLSFGAPRVERMADERRRLHARRASGLRVRPFGYSGGRRARSARPRPASRQAARPISRRPSPIVVQTWIRNRPGIASPMSDDPAFGRAANTSAGVRRPVTRCGRTSL